jgi:glycosyltransferase involved in cell wall biosynthesis
LIIKKSDNVDILLVCEGTFPYIKGGVSSWIYQLINGLNDFKFGVVFIGGNPKEYGEIKYKIPENLIHIETHFLFDFGVDYKKEKIEGNKDLVPKMRELHYWFRKHGDVLNDELKKIDFYNKIDEKQFLYSKKSFDFIKEEYYKNAPDVPFIDYFWTVRNIHSPIWKIVNIAKNIVNFKIVHSPSTGYAGFLGAFLKENYKKKFILTEHGIYLMERKIDIMLSNWIEEYKLNILKSSNETNYIKELWIRFFQGINKFAYETADKIISLYNGARNTQILLGADINKTEVIPNGVNMEKFENIYKKRKQKKEFKNVVTFVGRVVPIKDIKTFITAIKIASQTINDIEGWIIGPTDEDKEYYNECIEHVRTLNAEKNIKFFGFKPIEEILSDISIITLTSISEGMPLVILEAFAAGIPAVCTNVGSCSELIYGKNEEDIKIGKAGEITPVANPTLLAKNYIELLTDKNIYEKYSKNALERVKRYYDEKKLFDRYKEIYKQYIQGD